MLKFYLTCLCFVWFINLNTTAQTKHSNDQFGGIGISVDIDSSQHLPYIVELISGKPGAMYGLRSGDYILSINNWNTQNKKSEQVAQKLRGKVGSTIVLLIRRGSDEFKISIVRQSIIVDNQPANLCDALDRMMKASVDTFSKIIGKKLNESIENKQRSSLEWESSLKLPKFSKTSIMKNGNNDAYFKAIYFQGKDSIQAIHLFDRLFSDVRDCLAYTCAESYQETNTAVITGFSTTFAISQVKSNNPASIKGSVITVIYEHQRGMPQEVRLEYNLKK